MALYTDYKNAEETVIDDRAINNAIRNILLTPIGSMPGKPTFGSNLYRIPFSPLDHITIDITKRYIKEALRKWETRINIEDVIVEDVPEFNKVIATINYSYKDKGLVINDSATINLAQ